MPYSSPALDRRHFLGTASASAARAGSLAAARAADAPTPPATADARPPVTNPRATSGDTKHSPKWDELFTLTVATPGGTSTAPTSGRSRPPSTPSPEWAAAL